MYLVQLCQMNIVSHRIISLIQCDLSEVWVTLSAGAKFVNESNSVNPCNLCVLFKSLYCMVYRSGDISCVLNSEKTTYT